jgi:hypothetical protein
MRGGHVFAARALRQCSTQHHSAAAQPSGVGLRKTTRARAANTCPPLIVLPQGGGREGVGELDAEAFFVGEELFLDAEEGLVCF